MTTTSYTTRAQYILEARCPLDGRWAAENCGHAPACVFTSERAARAALAGMIKIAGYERSRVRIRRREWSEGLERWVEVTL